MEQIVIAYETRSSKGLYTDLAQAVYPGTKIISISNFRNAADIWTGDYVYDDLGSFGDGDYREAELEIISRCRFLRSLDVEQAKMLASKVWKGISGLFERYQVIAVFQRMIDEYTLDIMERIATLHGVPVVSYVGHFFNGYFRITTRGELNNLRDNPSEAEIERVCKRVLNSGFKPSFELMREKSQAQVVKTYLRRKVIENLYYPFMKAVDRDPLNYHYNTTVLRGIGVGCVSRNRYKGFSSVESLSSLDCGKAVYLPLHMIPEATTDYWCDDWHLTRYEQGIVGVIESSDKDVIFIIKEHPSMDGWRNPSFYKRLKEFPNVYLIPPNDNSIALLNMVNNVVVHTGSVGVEALMRGKRAFCLTSNYYSGLHPAAKLVDSICVNQLSASIPKYDVSWFVRDLLKGLYPGTWIPNKGCRNSSFDALVAASKEYLRRYNA